MEQAHIWNKHCKQNKWSLRNWDCMVPMTLCSLSRVLSCFCNVNMDIGGRLCDNVTYVSAFVMMRLESYEATIETWQNKSWSEIEECQIHSRVTAIEAHAAILEVRYNFVVLADEGREGLEFWILQCIEILHAVEEIVREDTEGSKIYPSKQIVIWIYYKEKRKKATSFVWEDPSRPILIYSHWY